MVFSKKIVFVLALWICVLTKKVINTGKGIVIHEGKNVASDEDNERRNASKIYDANRSPKDCALEIDTALKRDANKRSNNGKLYCAQLIVKNLYSTMFALFENLEDTKNYYNDMRPYINPNTVGFTKPAKYCENRYKDCIKELRKYFLLDATDENQLNHVYYYVALELLEFENARYAIHFLTNEIVPYIDVLENFLTPLQFCEKYYNYKSNRIYQEIQKRKQPTQDNSTQTIQKKGKQVLTSTKNIQT